MARLPALVDVLGEFDIRGRSTVEHIARVIREDGLIQTTKRGRGAAQMTAEDAASLLIGLNATEVPKDAANAVRRLAEQHLVRSQKFRDMMTASSCPDLMARLARQTTFGKAITFLISAAPDFRLLADEMRASADSRSPDRIFELSLYNSEPLHGFLLKVTFHPPLPIALIRFELEDTAGSTRQFLFRYGTMSSLKKEEVDRIGTSDRKVEVSIGLRTFERLHNLLEANEFK